MTFTDDDLKRLKEWLRDEKYDGPVNWTPYQTRQFNALIARLEAAEEALMSCRRWLFDDGFIIIEQPDVEKYEAWRKSCGRDNGR